MLRLNGALKLRCYSLILNPKTFLIRLKRVLILSAHGIENLECKFVVLFWNLETTCIFYFILFLISSYCVHWFLNCNNLSPIIFLFFFICTQISYPTNDCSNDYKKILNLYHFFLCNRFYFSYRIEWIPLHPWMLYWETNKTTKTKEENDKREINVAQEHFCPNHVGTFVHFTLRTREIAFWWVKRKTPKPHQFSLTFSILNKHSKYHFFSPPFPYPLK